jgi:hypothetical protein
MKVCVAGEAEDDAGIFFELNIPPLYAGPMFKGTSNPMI